jgi:hypothetical protein
MCARRWGGLLLRTPYGRAALGRRDATYAQRARSGIAAKLVEKHLTKNQMFGSRKTAGPTDDAPGLHQLYINGYG